MASAIASTVVDRPAAQVFAYATDPAYFAEWQQGVIEGHLDPPGPAQVGTKCLTTRRIGGANQLICVAQDYLMKGVVEFHCNFQLSHFLRSIVEYRASHVSEILIQKVRSVRQLNVQKLNVRSIGLFRGSEGQLYDRCGRMGTHHVRQKKKSPKNQQHDYRARQKSHGQTPALFAIRGFSGFHEFLLV